MIAGQNELNDAFCECIGNIKHLQTLKIISFREIPCIILPIRLVKYLS